MPPKKRLRPDNLIICNRHPGLVKYFKLSLIQRPSQAILSLEPGLGVFSHRWRKIPMAIPSGFFGLIQSKISTLHESVYVFAIHWKDADADTSCHLKFAGLYLDRFGQFAANAASYVVQLFPIARL